VAHFLERQCTATSANTHLLLRCLTCSSNCCRLSLWQIHVQLDTTTDACQWTSKCTDIRITLDSRQLVTLTEFHQQFLYKMMHVHDGFMTDSRSTLTRISSYTVLQRAIKTTKWCQQSLACDWKWLIWVAYFSIKIAAKWTVSFNS